MKKCVWISILLLVILLSFSCGKMSRNGTAPANLPPEVFLVNIPPDSVNFSTLAKIYWYGFDQDGYIARYQYLVIIDTGNVVPKSGGYIDSTFVKTLENVSSADWNDSSLSRILGINRTLIHSVDSVANSVGTFDNVMLFASVDSTAYVEQYFFVRGVDNGGAGSKIWKPDSPKGSDFRFFTRTNRPPVSMVNYGNAVNVTGNYVYQPDTLCQITAYSLPETTVDWKGIKFTWSAVDPDYSSRSQPAFGYSWQLFGPFDSKTSIDTTKVYYYSWDNTSGTPWTDSTTHIFVNLVNAPGKDYAWYQFRLTARDDAFVPDPTPASITFKIIKPPFLFSPANGKSILLVDATSYGGGLVSPRTGVLQGFYKGILDSLISQYPDEGIRYSFYRGTDVTRKPPIEDTLSHYKLVIIFNEGRFSGIQGSSPSSPFGQQDSAYMAINNYLSVGGRLFMIGFNNFGGIDELGNAMYVPIGPNPGNGFAVPGITLANYFCGVTGYFSPYLATSDSSGVIIRKPGEEMIAAEPFDSARTGLPRLEVDTTKLVVAPGATSNAYYLSILPPGLSLKGIPRAGWESVWNANYNERLYTFISFSGTGSTLNGRPCGSRAYSPDPWVFTDENGQHILQWRTAEFCFPALPMKNQQMVTMMKVMVDWFMQDEYLP
ncbi:MAG TPA: hypothetical protein VMT04_09455 [Terriglobales bacterium]|nr:hypothetical protein [Terriglobales bacterium]